jgi:hypothetical protein
MKRYNFKQEVHNLKDRLCNLSEAFFHVNPKVESIEFEHPFIVYDREEDYNGSIIRVPCVVTGMNKHCVLQGRDTNDDGWELNICDITDVMEMAHILDALYDGRFKVDMFEDELEYDLGGSE